MSDKAWYGVREYAQIIEGTVTDVNMKQWTVDVYSKRTGRNFPDVQISSPYLHHNSGEGMYAVPDIGATCMLCIPADDSEPYVTGFIAPPKIEGEKKPTDTISDEDTQDNQSAPSGFTYSMDRPMAVPGDIYIRGRSGNHVILHSEGVLEIGSSAISNRIYMPLGHVIDFVQDYAMRTPGGTIHWGIQDITGNKEATWQQTLRVHADDKYADIKISKGYVDPVTPPASDDNDALKMDPIYEVSVIKNGFTDNGDQVSHEMTMLFRFDREGNVVTKAWGNAYVKIEGTLSVKAKGGIAMETDSAMVIKSTSTSITSDSVTIASSNVKIAGGGIGVARVGDQVTVVLPLKLAAIAETPFIYGSINTGSSSVKVS